MASLRQINAKEIHWLRSSSVRTLSGTIRFSPFRHVRVTKQAVGVSGEISRIVAYTQIFIQVRQPSGYQPAIWRGARRPAGCRTRGSSACGPSVRLWPRTEQTLSGIPRVTPCHSLHLLHKAAPSPAVPPQFALCPQFTKAVSTEPMLQVIGVQATQLRMSILFLADDNALWNIGELVH